MDCLVSNTKTIANQLVCILVSNRVQKCVQAAADLVSVSTTHKWEKGAFMDAIVFTSQLLKHYTTNSMWDVHNMDFVLLTVFCDNRRVGVQTIGSGAERQA